MRILITGANGFIGKSLVKKLLHTLTCELNLITRTNSLDLNDSRIKCFLVEDIASYSEWDKILYDCDVVIHTAARVHILKEQADDPLAEFRKINVDATVNLAKQAATLGVKRFIFLSTIGIYGSETIDGAKTEESCYNPQTPYALSKLEAENELIQISQSTGMDVVIIRPPLVYAEDAPGNFGSLLKLINKKIFLPFAGIKNARNFISRDNLIDFICCCVENPMAKNQAFVIADSEHISTPDLIKYLREGMGISKLIIPFPIGIIKWVCKILGKETVFNQLSGSLQINSSKAQKLLNWQPKMPVKDSLRQVGANYKKNHQHIIE